MNAINVQENQRIIGFSIVICCYNSALRIEETLKHLFSIQIDESFDVEILLINNNSSDETADVAFKCATDLNINKVPFLIIDEPTPGLMHARNKGIENAQYDLIVFCDDDNHLESNYLQVAFQTINNIPEVAILGGWCKPKLPFFPGKWIEPIYAALAIEKEPKVTGYVDWVFGAGMIIRKALFNSFDAQQIKLLLSDRVGNKQSSGGDAEICQLARFLGHKVYYSSQLILHHKISPSRLTRWSFIKANYRNVFMVIYFFLLDKVIRNPANPPQILYQEFIRSKVSSTIFYLPRIFFGKNSFFSFIMFYQNVQVIFWLLTGRRKFMEVYELIKGNLYMANGRK